MTRGWLIIRDPDGAGQPSPTATALLAELDDSVLRPAADQVGDVEVAVSWSSLNYKDALAFAGNAGVARISPLVPGIDVVGTVVSSSNPRWSAGDRVVLNGAGAGETRNGGLAERAFVDGETLVAIPPAFTDAHAAGIGTAGFTAMLAVLALERHGVTSGPVLVTGASGGLGSFAVALLARAGFTVTAVTGRLENTDALLSFGATSVIDRAELDREAKPLESQRFAAVVDSVGGRSLATALAQVQQNGAAVACGNAASASLPTTVMPFILRGVSLLGINSTLTPLPVREAAWQRLARDLDPAIIERVAHPIALADAESAASELLAGRIRGRVSVSVKESS